MESDGTQADRQGLRAVKQTSNTLLTVAGEFSSRLRKED